MDIYSKMDLKILDVCKNEYKYFLKKINVVGIALGYKIINGFYTNIKCIKVFVYKKIKNAYLRRFDLIPKYYKGIVTDVVQGGEISSYGLTGKVRPAMGGYIAGNSFVKRCGTISCMVKDKRYYYLLGNNHAFANENDTPLETPILQPCSMFGGKYPIDEIANLSKFILLKFKNDIESPENFVDCAIARITKKSLVSTKIAIIGTLNGMSYPSLGEVIKKVGAITELTLGKITNLGFTGYIKFKRGECLFKNLIVTSKMSESGDSGALLVDRLNKVEGQLIAGSNTVSLYTPIETVLKALNVSIVNKD